METYRIKWYADIIDYVKQNNPMYSEIKRMTFGELNEYINAEHEKTKYFPMITRMQYIEYWIDYIQYFFIPKTLVH